MLELDLLARAHLLVVVVVSDLRKLPPNVLWEKPIWEGVWPDLNPYG